MVCVSWKVTKDIDWIRRHTGDLAVSVADVTGGTSVLGLFGPRSQLHVQSKLCPIDEFDCPDRARAAHSRSRDLLEVVSDADFSNEAFPFSTSQVIV